MSILEKRLKEFQKKPGNRNCFVCNQKGPQYFVMDFLTLVCTGCSGVHREFSHTIKHLTLATWTKEEVDTVVSGGNKKAAKKYLKSWDENKYPRPQPSDKVGVREFIQNCFVDQIWAGKAPKKDDYEDDYEDDYPPKKGKKSSKYDDEEDDFAPRKPAKKPSRFEDDEDDFAPRKPAKNKFL